MRLLKEYNLSNKVMNKLVEEENSFLTTFMNKYKPLYDTQPKISSDGTVIADQIQLKGSGISKRVEAALYPEGNMEVANEEWGFVYTKSGINVDSVESMSQYWFYDDYMNNEEFRAKIDKATASLYKDMVKLRGAVVPSNTALGESLSPEEEKELAELKRDKEQLEKQLGDKNLKGQQRVDIENDIKDDNRRIAELERNNSSNKAKPGNSELNDIKDKLNSLVENNACLEFGSETPVDKVGADFSYQRWFYYKQSSPARKILLLVTVSVPEKWVYVRLDNGKGSLNPLNTDFINIMSNLQKIFSSYTLK